jgi:hypothetical protein
MYGIKKKYMYKKSSSASCNCHTNCVMMSLRWQTNISIGSHEFADDCSKKSRENQVPANREIARQSLLFY